MPWDPGTGLENSEYRSSWIQSLKSNGQFPLMFCARCYYLSYRGNCQLSIVSYLSIIGKPDLMDSKWLRCGALGASVVVVWLHCVIQQRLKQVTWQPAMLSTYCFDNVSHWSESSQVGSVGCLGNTEIWGYQSPQYWYYKHVPPPLAFFMWILLIKRRLTCLFVEGRNNIHHR